MDYEVVVTLGPGSADASLWAAFAGAGATAFRLNTSHVELDDLDRWLERFARSSAGGGHALPLILDLQGSKWRLGALPAPLDLAAGDALELVCAPTAPPGQLPVPHPDFFRAAFVATGDVVLNDARVRAAIERVDADRVRARVTQGGTIAGRKGITLADSGFRSESLSEKDREILARTRHVDGVCYAISYVKDAVEMASYRALCGPSAHLIAKLERGSALEDVDGIAHSADALWLCRGDLGAELGLVEMAAAVHSFSERVARLRSPVLMAGQVLDSMTVRERPTRSEICYLYDALLKGYRGVVLSDETAIGPHPLASCRAAALFRGVLAGPAEL